MARFRCMPRKRCDWIYSYFSNKFTDGISLNESWVKQKSVITTSEAAPSQYRTCKAAQQSVSRELRNPSMKKISMPLNYTFRQAGYLKEVWQKANQRGGTSRKGKKSASEEGKTIPLWQQFKKFMRARSQLPPKYNWYHSSPLGRLEELPGSNQI